jgi:hypothetical protein
MDLLMHASYGLPPVEAAAIVLSFYFKATMSRSVSKAQAF